MNIRLLIIRNANCSTFSVFKVWNVLMSYNVKVKVLHPVQPSGSYSASPSALSLVGVKSKNEI